MQAQVPTSQISDDFAEILAKWDRSRKENSLAKIRYFSYSLRERADPEAAMADALRRTPKINFWRY
jgi:hypothetical protein